MQLNSRVKTLIVDAHAAWYAEALGATFARLDCVTAAPGRVGADVAADAEVVVAFGSGVPRDVFSLAPRLRWVQLLSAGSDAVLANPRLPADVLVTTMSGIHGPMLSEMAAYLMLSLARDARRTHANQASATWARAPGFLLHGKTVLVVGTGTSGEQIGRVCRAMGMRVRAASATPRPLGWAEECVDIDRLAEHVGDVTVVILATASTAKTRNCIGEPVLSRMQPGSYLVNVGRGDLLDDQAVLAALDRGQLAGAALDAFREEPLPRDHPYWRHEKVLVTPHLGGLVQEYEQMALPVLVENFGHYLAGRTAQLRNLVHGRQAA